MKYLTKAAVALILLLLCSNALCNDNNDYYIAKSNFTYKADKGNHWDYYDIHKPFKGDCEDFCWSLQRVIGGDIWYTKVRGRGHAVLVKGSTLYDINNNAPIPIKIYNHPLLFKFNLQDVINYNRLHTL